MDEFCGGVIDEQELFEAAAARENVRHGRQPSLVKSPQSLELDQLEAIARHPSLGVGLNKRTSRLALCQSHSCIALV